jgi:Zn-dependent M28 family amino/carboxypeptidase
MISKLVAALALAIAAPLASQPVRRAAHPAPAIDTMALRAHTYFLTHDLLEGRGTGRRGNDVAALYLATAAQGLGLVGGAEGSFFQDVPLVEAVIDTARTRILVTADSGPAREFTTPVAFVPNVGTASTLVPFAGELAYVGTARDVLASPGQLPVLTGRVAVVRGPFGPAMAAADTLRAHGATGAVQLVDNADQYLLYVRSRGPSRMYIAPEAHAISSFIPDIPTVIVSAELGQILVPNLPAPGTAADHPFVVAGRRLELRIAVHARAFASRNVAALLPGTGPDRGEFVLYTAHYDHLGISTPNARGDSIYNGFADNAIGCAMLLAVAETMARGPRPDRSILFLLLTGEERGLLGSDYFAAHPLVAPERIAAAINLDAGAPPGPNTTWLVAGGDRSTLGALAAGVAARAGWKAPSAGVSPNSDYYPLLRIGVPAVFLIPGSEPFEGLTAEASQALRRRFGAYHDPADEWAFDFPFAGPARYALYAYRLGMAAAAGPRQRMLAAP